MTTEPRTVLQCEDEELVRYGLRWQGHDHAIVEPMDDGYWTPWHIASATIARLEAELAEVRQLNADLTQKLEVAGNEGWAKGMREAAKMADEHNSYAKLGERLSFNDLAQAIRSKL